MQELSADGPRLCEFCGDPLRKGVRKETRFCSTKCSYDRRVAEGWVPGGPGPVGRSKPPTKNPCIDCGTTVVSKANPQSKVRCRNCWRWVWAIRNREYRERCAARGYRPPSVERARRTRRRRIRGATGGTAYTLAYVAARDRWRCHICGKQVLDVRVPDHMAPTVDHLIPISDGGTDSAENVALAHFICNTRRGTRGQAQLRLVG